MNILVVAFCIFSTVITALQVSKLKTSLHVSFKNRLKSNTLDDTESKVSIILLAVSVEKKLIQMFTNIKIVYCREEKTNE